MKKAIKLGKSKTSSASSSSDEYLDKKDIQAYKEKADEPEDSEKEEGKLNIVEEENGYYMRKLPASRPVS